MLASDLGHVIGYEVWIGARRMDPLRAPGSVGLYRIAADKLQRLRARRIAQGLALQMASDRKDFEPALLRLRHALFGVFLGAGVGRARGEVELPASLFPAVEPSLCDPIEPLVFR